MLAQPLHQWESKNTATADGTLLGICCMTTFLITFLIENLIKYTMMNVQLIFTLTAFLHTFSELLLIECIWHNVWTATGTSLRRFYIFKNILFQFLAILDKGKILNFTQWPKIRNWNRKTVVTNLFLKCEQQSTWQHWNNKTDFPWWWFLSKEGSIALLCEKGC